MGSGEPSSGVQNVLWMHYKCACSVGACMRVWCVCVHAHLPAEVRKGIRVTDVWEIPAAVLGTENSGPLREQPDH